MLTNEQQDQQDELVVEGLQRVLEIPGVYEAIALAAMKELGPHEMKSLYNEGIAMLGDVPSFFIRQTFYKDE